MAFSYSDENFTVVGNLCFVHIKTTTTGKKSINIPPALADRMLIDDYCIISVSTILDDTVSSTYGDTVPSTYIVNTGPVNLSFVKVKDKKITFDPPFENTYINFSFPINSNK